jgi:ribonuclease BN (tRNA processing enzyme)
MAARGECCACLSADPGSPVFGPPGAVTLGTWHEDDWLTLETEALCTLDAGRFRLPLMDAVRRLLARAPAGTLLIDAPGVVRGVAGAELVLSLAEAAAVEIVLCVVRDTNALPLNEELGALPVSVLLVPAATTARRPGKGTRARSRTRLWDAYLSGTTEHRLDADRLNIVGTPPPPDLPASWAGRQAGFLDKRGRTLGLGEILSRDGNTLVIRTAFKLPADASLLVRDAQRMKDGLLGTAEPGRSGVAWFTPPPDLSPAPGLGKDAGPRPVVRMGAATAILINGIFGDPLLHLRLRHQKRSLLFDIGEAGRLPARIAHQVSDVFVSHAHFDHIAGFLWLLRSRVGVSSPCRLFGPPGLARHIQSLINGIHWDRIGEHGPRFEVNELHDEQLLSYSLRAGRPDIQGGGERRVDEGCCLLEEAGFRVRAVTLDHGIPVLAFAFETQKTLNIRKERLISAGLPVGPWLGDLKQRVLSEKYNTNVQLPDGSSSRVGTLADELIRVTPGQKLVYATDLADTPRNRERLTALARGAHTLFLESAFMETDIDQARRTGHLTARACGEIGSAADVERLVPFHFSRRYEGEPQKVYDEVRAACPRALLPRGL